MVRFLWIGKLVVLVVLQSSCTKMDQPIGSEVFVDSRDGRAYPTVKIGNQLWMSKNLAFESDSSWCYKDDSTDCDENGRLYTWEDACEVCPEGWRLSTEEDWIQLEEFLGMAQEELQKRKFRGTNQGARLRIGGDTGFNAPISGYRRPNGSYDRRGQRSAYWLGTEVDSSAAWHRDIRSDTGAIYRSTVPKSYALSVRCLKNSKQLE